MKFTEEAAISYQPNGEPSKLEFACAEAERQLNHLKNVLGFGISQTLEGEDAVLVFVKTKETLTQLPNQISGVPLIGEVTGEIWAQ